MRNPRYPNEVESPSEFLEVWKENRAELVKFLEGIPEEKFTAKPEKGWSASEIAEHLYLVQWNLARSIPVVAGGKFGFAASELKTDLRYETLFKLVSKPRGAKNPEDVGPKGGMDKKTALESLQKAMDRFEKNLTGRSASELKSRGMEHPFFGPISLFDWLWVMANHEYSHITALFQKYS